MMAAAHPAPAPAQVRALRALVLVLLALLASGCVAWELWLAPIGRGTLAFKALPLLPLVPGLMRHRLWSYRALALLVWLYVGEGLVRSTSEGGTSRWLAAAEVVLALALFGAVVGYVRLRLPRRRGQGGQEVIT